jgi:predicted transcriptional regulator
MDRKLETPKVKDILVKKVIAFRPDFTSIDAIKCFIEYKISTAPVVNENNEVIGYLSESDCIKCLSNCLFYDETRNRTIDLIMSKEVAVAEGTWDIFKLETFFVSNHLRSAPVVDSGNHLVGIVTRKDALLALEKCMQERQEYKSEIKTPIELNMRERIKMIVNRV